MDIRTWVDLNKPRNGKEEKGRQNDRRKLWTMGIKDQRKSEGSERKEMRREEKGRGRVRKGKN